MADLFELEDLRKTMQLSPAQFNADAATVARRRASGWLMYPTGLSVWPDPVPDDLWGWAIELAAIAYRNPTGVSNESVDDHQVGFDRHRRAEILEAAGRSYGSGTPQYSFPEWDWHWVAVPDPALLD